jgi:hypothetical protein
MAQEAAQVRRNEFLQLVLNSPIAQQITGVEGTAALMRENAKTLDMDVDKVVPNTDKLRMQEWQRAQAMQQAQQQVQAAQGALGGVQPPAQPGAAGSAPSGPAAAPAAQFPKQMTVQPGAQGAPGTNMPGVQQQPTHPTLGAGPMASNRQRLPTGRPISDHFSPPRR